MCCCLFVVVVFWQEILTDENRSCTVGTLERLFCLEATRWCHDTRYLYVNVTTARTISVSREHGTIARVSVGLSMSESSQSIIYRVARPVLQLTRSSREHLHHRSNPIFLVTERYG